EISVKTGNNARNGGKNSLNRLIRCVCGKKIGPDPRNFNQRVNLGRNDLLIRTFPNTELSQAEISWRVGYENVDHFAKLFLRHVGCSPSDYRRQFKNCFAEQEILSEFPQPVSLVG
ncbi:TPA: helix-turn-helix domain-containing protein, partial [Escherichia coli]